MTTPDEKLAGDIAEHHDANDANEQRYERALAAAAHHPEIVELVAECLTEGLYEPGGRGKLTLEATVMLRGFRPGCADGEQIVDAANAMAERLRNAWSQALDIQARKTMGEA